MALAEQHCAVRSWCTSRTTLFSTWSRRQLRSPCSHLAFCEQHVGRIKPTPKSYGDGQLIACALHKILVQRMLIVAHTFINSQRQFDSGHPSMPRKIHRKLCVIQPRRTFSSSAQYWTLATPHCHTQKTAAEAEEQQRKIL